MTAAERTAMYTACRCCTLAAAMRDCRTCLFNIGIIAQFVESEPATVAQAEREVYGECPENIGDKPPYVQEPPYEPRVRYTLSRTWADQHLNSDEDVKHFKGGAQIIG
jgi:hypothetical protein